MCEGLAMELGEEDMKDSSLMGTNDGEVLCNLVARSQGAASEGRP